MARSKNTTYIPDDKFHWEEENKQTIQTNQVDYSLETKNIPTFTSVVSYDTFPDDFLIINDIYFTSVPTTSISFESNSDAFIAETLRTPAPVITTEGREDFIVNISLAFKPGKEQSETLRRLLGEITRYPLMFVYNNRIKKALNVGEFDTTIFILDSGNIRSTSDTVGLIILDLTMHYFEYRPFSNHFFYNSYLANAPNEPNTKVSKLDIPLKLGESIGYESSEYNVSKYAQQVKDDIQKAITSAKLKNVPVAFPSQSSSWMYYADNLCSEKLIPKLFTEVPSDYIGFSVREFIFLNPPSEARQGQGNAYEFFNKEAQYKEWVYPWKVGSKEGSSQLTYQEQEVESLITDVDNISDKDSLAIYTYRNRSMQIDDNTALWLGRMLIGENSSSEEVMASLLWAIVNRWGYGSKDASLYWWIRNFSQPVNLRWLPGGDKYEYWKAKDPNHQRVSEATVSRRYRVSSTQWNDLPARVRDIVTRFRQGKVQIPSNWKKVENNLFTNWASYKGVDKKCPGGLWINGEWFFQDMFPSGRIKVEAPKNPSKQPDPPKSLNQSDIDLLVARKREEVQSSKSISDKKKATKEYQEALNEKRLKWISGQEENGFVYYSKDPNVRNIFYRQLSANVSGDYASVSHRTVLPNIVCSALSISFGHRIAPMKLSGQLYNSYQFLGAGNKTGQIALTFAGEAGKKSADLIKEIIKKAKINAQSFGSLIQEAGAIELLSSNYDSNEQNAILTLMNINSVIITGFQEANDPSGVDKYQLIISFIAQDFAEEQFDKDFVDSFDNRKKIIAALLNLVNVNKIENEYGKQVHKLNELTNMGEYKGEKTFRLYFSVGSNEYPAWLYDILSDLCIVLDSTNKKMPPVYYKALLSGSKDRTWKEVYSDWGAPFFVGSEDNVDTSVTGQFFGNSTDDIIYYTDKKHQEVFREWIDKMSSLVNRVTNNIGDRKNFETYFGSIGEDTLNAIVKSVGLCYEDLFLPNIPGTDIPFPPEFYIYDDSSENPLISGATNPANMKLLLQKHMDNELASMKHFLEDAYLGGSYLSKNFPKILESARLNHTNFNGETGFLKDYFNLLTEGAYSWDPIYYRDDPSIDNSASVNLWKTKVANGLSKGVFSDDRTNFVDNIISLSSYLKEGRQWEYGDGEKTSIFSFSKDDKFNLINLLYGETYDQIGFGPNSKYAEVDKLKRSSVLDLIPEDYTENQTKNYFDYKDYENKVSYDASAEIAYNNSISTISNIKEELPPLKELDSLFAKLDTNTFSGQVLSNLSQLPIAPGTSAANYLTRDISPIEEQRNKIGRMLFGQNIAPQITELAKKKTVSETVAEMSTGIALGNIRNDISMRRAFPTFKIYFIEEDANVDTEFSNKEVRRAFDDFYSYSAIQEIVVTRSRKISADLAVIRMTNIGGKLFRIRFGEKEENRQTFSNSEKQGIYAETERENPFEKLVLQDGVKVQIRIGYSGSSENLETIFLGQVVEIQPAESGRLIEITCQGYGAELEATELGPLEDGPVFWSTQQALSAAIIQDSIVNFGRQNRFNRYNPAEMRHAWTGGSGESRSVLARPISGTIGAFLKYWSDNKIDKLFHQYTFLNEPQDDNIFAPPPSVYTTKWDRFWNNACIYRPIKQTSWQIFQEHELRHPGYISLAVPYGHSSRMTMFFGSKNQFYWKGPPSALELYASENHYNDVLRARGALNHYNNIDQAITDKIMKLADSSVDLAKAVVNDIASNSSPNHVNLELGKLFGRYVPFRNYHYLDSEHHIIKNEIRTSVDGTYNQIELLYFESEDDLQDSELNIISDDTEAENLLEAINKMHMEEDGFLTTKLDENIPESSIRSIREEYPSCVTLQMAKRYTQGLFARYLRDAYKGELVIVGKETIKPYDVINLADNNIAMYGPIEVEEVTHIFNKDNGFISIITPDLCVDTNDIYSMSVFDTAIAANSYCWEFAQSMNPAFGAFYGLVSPFMFISHLGAAKFMSWTQDGMPVVANPLSFQGRPFLSNVVNPKHSSMILIINGQWRQYWDDLSDAWNKMDIGETFLDIRLDLTTKILGLLGTSPKGY